MGPQTGSVGTVRRVDLPERGSTLVHEVRGSDSAPALVLLHGLTLTAELNWRFSFPALGRRFRVVGFDQRGHGQGICPGVPFSLEDCADDTAALVEILDLAPVTAVGYSMGGLVAQLLWRRHPHLVSGLVLCSTVDHLRWSPLAALLPWWCPPLLVRPEILGANLIGPLDDPTLRRWAIAAMRRSDPRAVSSAIGAAARFDSRAWIGEIDVPTAVVVTTLDDVVPPKWQRELAGAVPHAVLYEIEGTHGVAITHPRLFVPVLIDACSFVTAWPRTKLRNGDVRSASA